MWIEKSMSPKISHILNVKADREKNLSGCVRAVGILNLLKDFTV